MYLQMWIFIDAEFLGTLGGQECFCDFGHGHRPMRKGLKEAALSVSGVLFCSQE